MDPTPSQLRAARAWIGWNLDDAAEKSGVSRKTILRVENGQSVGHRDTIRAIVKAYADAGVWLDHGEMMNQKEKDAAVMA